MMFFVYKRAGTNCLVTRSSSFRVSLFVKARTSATVFAADDASEGAGKQVLVG
jgi:hypothetical protein